MGAETAADQVAVLVSYHGSMHIMYLVTYVIFGIALAILVFALYPRLKNGAPSLARGGAAVGLLWAFMLVASGLIFNAGMAAVVALHGTNSRATSPAAWTLPCSWWRLSKTTTWSVRPRRSSAAKRRQRSNTLEPRGRVEPGLRLEPPGCLAAERRTGRPIRPG